MYSSKFFPPFFQVINSMPECLEDSYSILHQANLAVLDKALQINQPPGAKVTRRVGITLIGQLYYCAYLHYINVEEMLRQRHPHISTVTYLATDD